MSDRASIERATSAYAGGPVTFHGVDVFTFDGSGHIASVRAYWERALLHEQLEGLPRA